MSSEHVYSDIYNYDIPVFKIASKDGYSKVILNKLTLPNEFMNVNYNTNCLRWIRKVDTEGADNPYFTTNSPENEFHLCSLYLAPGNYKNRQEIIDEVNKDLKIVANSLFSNANSVKNLYTEYRYRGTIPTQFSITNARPKTITYLYPDINKTGKYRVLINYLNEYGVSYSFQQPNTFIMFRDGDVYESLALGLTNTYLNNSTGTTDLASFKTKYIQGQNDAFTSLVNDLKTYRNTLENSIPKDPTDPDYNAAKRLYDTYCTVLDSYRLNDSNYSMRDGMFEIYNGLLLSNKIYEGINTTGELVFNNLDFNHYTYLVYDGVNMEYGSLDEEIKYKVYEEEKETIFGHTWICLGYAVFNLIHQYLLSCRAGTASVSSTDLINACIALNIYEIDESFINNYVYLNEDDFALYEEKFKNIAKKWVARLLNQFIFHTIFGRANSWNTTIDKDVAYKQFDQMHGLSSFQKYPQNDSIDWFSNKVIDVLRRISVTYADYDKYIESMWMFDYDITSFGTRDDKTVDQKFNASSTNLLDYIISRSGPTLIPDLNSSLRFMIQSFTGETYFTLVDAIENKDRFIEFEELLLANKTTSVTIDSIQYSLYNSGGRLQNSVPVDFVKDHPGDLEALAAQIEKMSINSNGTSGIGALTFSKIASDSDPCLTLIDGEVNGIVQKLTNVSDSNIELTVNSKSIIIKPGEYLALTNTSNNYAALKFHATFDSTHTGKTSLTEKMDVVQSLSKETVYNQEANSTTMNSKDTDPLLNDPYFRKLNDEMIVPFEIDEKGRKGLISNIGPLMFIESNNDVLPTVDDFTKYEYTLTGDVYTFNPDIYTFNQETNEINENKSSYKRFKYDETDSKIPNEYFKRRENSINIPSRIGLPAWKTDINPNDLCFVKLYNYTEVPFRGSLTSAYNITTADGKIHLKAGTTVAKTLTPFIFSSFSTESFKFTNSCSLMLPPVVYTCAITNKDIEKVISRSENSNQVYSFEPNYNSDLPQLTVKFSNEVKLTIPTGDTMYVFLSAPETPYAIPSGLARLDYSYIF